MLRHARESSGVRLDAVTAKTRIPRRFVDALERSDLAELPGGAFDRGYIKTIADLLEIDPGPVLEAYELEAARLGRGKPETEERLLRKLRTLVPEKKPAPWRFRPTRARLSWLAVALAAGTLVIAGALRSSSPPSPRTVVSSERRTESEMKRETEPQPRSTARSSPSREPDAAVDAAPPSGLAVSGFGLGTGLVDRTLTGRAERFAEGTRVLFWTRVVGGQSGEILRHVWLHEGRAVMRTRLTIGGPHWRTFSALTLPEDAAGPWTVEARGPGGALLAREEFVCLAGKP